MPLVRLLKQRHRERFNCFLILCCGFLIIGLIINQKTRIDPSESNTEEHSHSIINHIREIQILNQTYAIPNWIFDYNISSFFNFYWLKTETYQWHLQQMIDLQYPSIDRQTFPPNHTSIYNYLFHHPEYGVIIDTAADPFQSIFPPLPQTGSSLNEICLQLKISNDWYPCYTPSERIPSSLFQPLITYGLYHLIIGNSSLRRIHYDEIIYLFDTQLNETYFIRQILPRFIRLLALVPETTVILSPYFDSKINYIDQYMDLLIERKVLNDRKRLIKYQSERSYHGYVVYSTSSPRSDLTLLQQILLTNQSSISRDLILIIRNHLENITHDNIIEIINQFEFPINLHIHEYHQISYNLNQISSLFSRAVIVIGMSSEILSHIVWCLPGTHIIEIGQKMMTTDYYEISLQLKFIYWLAGGNETEQIDGIDFRNLLMKVFTYLAN